MRCNEIRDSLALYALGEPIETDVEAHLESCRDCSVRLAEMSEALAKMHHLMPPKDPRPQVWIKIREQIHAEADGDRSARSVTTTAIQTEAARGKKTSFSRLRWGAAVLAAVLLISLAGWWSSNSALRLEREQLASLRAQMEASVQLWADGDMKRSRELRLEPLRESPAPTAQGGTAVYLGRNGGALLVVWASNLPATTGSETYQVWLNRAERRWSAGQLILDDEGNGILFAQATDTEFDSLGITLEPEPTLPSPAGPRVLVSSP